MSGVGEVKRGTACSFCLRDAADFEGVMIAGPAGNICDDCTAVCSATVQERVAEKQAVTSEPDVGPGSFSCHEALHMASFLFEAVSEKLCSHPTVQSDRQWARLAEDAETALWKLYQAIGGEHLA